MYDFLISMCVFSDISTIARAAMEPTKENNKNPTGDRVSAGLCIISGNDQRAAGHAPGPGFPGSTSAPGTEPGCFEGQLAGGWSSSLASGLGPPASTGGGPGGMALTFSGLFTGPSGMGIP